MTIEHELVELDRATASCTLLDLDAKNGGDAAVLMSPDGVAIRLSRSAAALVRSVRAGIDRAAIVAQLDGPAHITEAALAGLTRRIRDTFAAAVRNRGSGFVAQRRLVRGDRVTRWVRPLTAAFGPRAAIPLLALSLVLVAATWSGVHAAPRSPFTLWSGFAISLALMFVHELGHAAACKRHGSPVGDIGCAIYLIYPALFCDVTSTWALPRRARVVVDLGGIYFQLIATAVIAAVWQLTASGALAAAVRISTATMVLNLLPLGRLDGYWLLSDVLGVINLRAQQRVVAAALWAWLRRRPAPALPWSMSTTLAIAGYAIASSWFFGSILFRLLPQVVSEAVALPDRTHRLGAAIAGRDGAAILLGIAELASSVVIAWIAFALVRNLVRAALRMIRRTRPA